MEHSGSQSNRLLFLMAGQFASQRAYSQAAHCLTAICSQHTELPGVHALACLQLASLLLDHANNFQEARALLLTAEQDLRHMLGHHLLRCEVWAAIACCNQKLGAVAAEHKALTSGLKACRKGAASKDGHELAQWCTYFQFKLAEHGLAHEGQEAATYQLQLLEGQSLAPLERVLYLFSRATLHLNACEPTAAAAVVEELYPLIETVGLGNCLLHKQLCCHYSLVYIAMVVAAGRVNDLKQDPSGNIAMLVTLNKLLAEMQGAIWSYGWLHAAAVGAIGNFLHASLLRSLGKSVPAAAYLVQCQSLVAQQLAQCGIDMEARETQLSVQAIWKGRIFCHLSLLVVEQHALAALMASRFAQAGKLLAELTALLERFPSLLHACVFPTRMLLGYYAHSVLHHGAASSHFQAVMQSDAKHLHDAASLGAALAELHGCKGPSGLHRAVELLQRRELHTELIQTLPAQDRTAALLVNALVAQRSGDDSNARVMLTKGLKVLNVLAPIQAIKGDVAGAEQKLGSATTLAKAQGDLATLVCSSRGLLRIFAGDASNQRSLKQRDHLERKAGDFKEAVALAVAAPYHNALLGWAGPSSG